MAGQPVQPDMQDASDVKLLELPSEGLDAIIRRIQGDHKRQMEATCVRLASVGKKARRFAHCELVVSYTPIPTWPKWNRSGQLHVNGELVTSVEAIPPLLDQLLGRKRLRHLKFSMDHYPVGQMVQLQCNAVLRTLNGQLADRVRLESLWVEPSYPPKIIFGALFDLELLFQRHASSLIDLTMAVPCTDSMTTAAEIASLTNQLSSCTQLRSYTAGYTSYEWKTRLQALLPTLSLTTLCLHSRGYTELLDLSMVVPIAPTLTELRLDNVRIFRSHLLQSARPALSNIRIFSSRFIRMCGPTNPDVWLDMDSDVTRLIEEAMPQLELFIYQPAGVFNNLSFWRALRNLANACFKRGDRPFAVHLFENTWEWTVAHEWRSLARCQEQLPGYTVGVQGDTVHIGSPDHQLALPVTVITDK